MASSLSRHRAWVVDWCPQGFLVGSLRWALRGCGGASVEAPGNFSMGFLGGFFEAFRAPLGAPGRCSGVSWGLMGGLWGPQFEKSFQLPPLKPLWGPLRAWWAVLDLPCAVSGRSGLRADDDEGLADSNSCRAAVRWRTCCGRTGVVSVLRAMCAERERQKERGRESVWVMIHTCMIIARCFEHYSTTL